MRKKEGCIKSSAVKLLLLLFLLPCTASFAGEDIPGKLSEEDFFPGWRKEGKTKIVSAEELYGVINGGAELFLEFGFNRLVLQRYLKKDHELELAVYEMKDAFAASGIFLIKRGRGQPAPGIRGENIFSRYQALLRQGKYFAIITNPPGRKALEEEMMALANLVLPILGTPEKPAMLDLLPSEGMEPGSLRLIQGKLALETAVFFPDGIIDFKACEGVYADYPFNGKTVAVLRLHCSTPDARDEQCTVLCAEATSGEEASSPFLCAFTLTGTKASYYLFREGKVVTILTGGIEKARAVEFYKERLLK